MTAFVCSTFCTRILFFLLPFEIANQYSFEPLYLGLLGLVQAVLALSLAVVGGHFADRFNRRNLLLGTGIIQVACAVGLLIAERYAGSCFIGSVYVIMFFLGVARGFSGPAMPSLEAQIVPRSAAMSAAVWGTLVWRYRDIGYRIWSDRRWPRVARVARV